MSRTSVAGDTADPVDEKGLEERNETFVAAFNKGGHQGHGRLLRHRLRFSLG